MNSVFAQQLSLAGNWQFAIDRGNKGVDEQWYNKEFPETILLPGSMAERMKGDDVTLQTKWTASIYDSSFFFRPSLAKYRTKDNLKIPFWLTPAKHYVGPAWYRKEIIIPSMWKGERVQLFLERVHIKTRVWIDATAIGYNNSLSTPHEFDLGILSPGKHTITICTDNSIDDMNVGPDSHSVTDQTQGNWNGIIGKMYIKALPAVYIEDVQVYPDIKKKSTRIKINLVSNTAKEKKITVTASAESFNSSILHRVPAINKIVSITNGDTIVTEIDLPMTDKALLWDEFHPNLYRLTVKVIADASTDIKQLQFGMREFKIKGTQFMLNGNPVFLRGTLNNCEFPLTGYPAMDTAAWGTIFGTAKSFGVNHMRFHSWCPPEEAFIAADIAGFYLQPEAPTWPNHGTSVGDGRFIDQYIYEETNRMDKVYGNYASFCLLSAGNEPAGKNQVNYLTDFINYWKVKDTRHVYTGASVAMSWPLVPANEYMIKSGTRGLRWITEQPESISDFSTAIKDFTVPYLTHEMGQWCAFPAFDEIKDYTGVYKAKNFELFQQDLEDHGMGEQAKDFLMASGKLQVLCYKAEIEKDLRTAGLAGFQLLGLQDFPGQGTALVGVLNAFWKPKPYITTKQFKRFCNATVPLAQFPKFVFTNDEIFDANIELFHFGEKDLKETVLKWTVKNDKGEVVRSGKFDPVTFKRGNLQQAGKIQFALKDILAATHLNLEVSVADTTIANDWDFWVYPNELPRASGHGYEIYHCTSLDSTAEEVLNKGGKVFLNAYGKIVKGKEIAMYFTPVFWNTSWFKMRPPHVTGMLIESKHPAFKYFPTEYHSDFQWWSIVARSQVMHLEDFPKEFKPIVQPIDTWFMNRRLGLIFEAKIGNGKLLVTSADLSDTSSYPATRQLYYSLMRYMSGNEFNPVDKVDISVIRDLFVSPSKETWDSYTKDSPDELKPKITNSNN